MELMAKIDLFILQRLKSKARQVDSTSADVLSQTQSSATLRTGAIVRIMRQPWVEHIYILYLHHNRSSSSFDLRDSFHASSSLASINLIKRLSSFFPSMFE